MLSLSADEARRIALRAQGLLGAPDQRAGGVDDLLRRLGAVQLDTISVLARSHELVAYARLGAVGRDKVEEAYWSKPPRAFEYWAHAACVLPLESWPWCAYRRRKAWAYENWQRQPDESVFDTVKARLAEGQATATELGGAKRGGVWWDWSDVKVALERMLHRGEVACVERRGWKRVYALAEQVIPSELRDKEPDDEECRVHLIAAAGAALGVATIGDLADYYRQQKAPVKALVGNTGLVPVEVQGWGEPAWADPSALASPARGRHRTTLLSPFDSLIWDRPRTLRMFGFAHKLEAYVPKPKREFGYFAMPLLAGGRIVGRIDPAREGRALVARQVTLESPSAVPAAAAALREAATWVGSDTVVVERVEPAPARRSLAAAIRS